MTKKRATKLIMALGYQRNVAQRMLLDKHNSGWTNLDAYLWIATITRCLPDPNAWIQDVSQKVNAAIMRLTEAVSTAVKIVNRFAAAAREAVERMGDSNEDPGN